jgi:hypothetical protein
MNISNFSTKCELHTKLFFSSHRVTHLCDRLVFEFDSYLNDYEIKVLSRISMRYQGKATDRELSMIGDICARVGIAGGIE